VQRFVKTGEIVNRYEVRHPDGHPPHPTFKTWNEAVSAQKKWNKDYPGHRARKIPESEIPIEHKCPSCGDSFTGWPDEKGRVCFGCFAAKEL